MVEQDQRARAVRAQRRALYAMAELRRIKGKLFLSEGALNAAMVAGDRIRDALDWACRQGALSCQPADAVARRAAAAAGTYRPDHPQPSGQSGQFGCTLASRDRRR